MSSNTSREFAESVPHPRVQDVFKDDEIPPPRGLLEISDDDLSSADISVERYTSYEWHRKEVELVWKKTWQMACRVEEIPNPGDHIMYDIADDSVLIVRNAEGEINAFVNSCLHRGATLIDDSVNADGSGHCPARFVCPYHGWQYDLDGKLCSVPGAWDFSHLDLDNIELPSVNIGFWGGFVFINLDPNCGPLEEYLDILPAHLDEFDLENRYVAAHASKVAECNWKAAQEAFLEGYHVPQTHFNKEADGNIKPDYMSAVNNTGSMQYDYWEPHVTRLIQQVGMPAPQFTHLFDSEQDILNAYFANDKHVLEEGQTARQYMARYNRKVWSKLHNSDCSNKSDSEMLDQIQYTVFPNFTVWPALISPLLYRFRPYGDDPNRSLFEIYMLFPKADDGSHPEPMKQKHLDADTLWETLPEFGGYGPIIDQDTPNFPRIQKGMRASKRQAISLANYQESRIRAFHETLDRYLTGEFSK